jgi:hypothetical protein
MTTLNKKWDLWFHNLSNPDWTINGYTKIYTLETVEEFWEINMRMNINIIQNGMFFLMKEGIQPLWEHESNINGGCWSYKISKKECYISWVELLIAICGETLLEDKYNNIINGVSISPKKNFCIMKIWTNNNENSSNSLLSTNIYNLNISQCLYKEHKERPT